MPKTETILDLLNEFLDMGKEVAIRRHPTEGGIHVFVRNMPKIFGSEYQFIISKDELFFMRPSVKDEALIMWLQKAREALKK